MVRYSRRSVVACCLAGFCAPVTSLSVPPNDISKATIITTSDTTTISCRRTFFRNAPIVVAAIVTTTATLGHGTVGDDHHHHRSSCHCDSCTTTTPTTSTGRWGQWQQVQPVMAYERRDVGGDKPSGEMQAMNIQAYETMSRLEKSGVKLEVKT